MVSLWFRSIYFQVPTGTLRHHADCQFHLRRPCRQPQQVSDYTCMVVLRVRSFGGSTTLDKVQTRSTHRNHFEPLFPRPFVMCLSCACHLFVIFLSSFVVFCHLLVIFWSSFGGCSTDTTTTVHTSLYCSPQQQCVDRSQRRGRGGDS